MEQVPALRQRPQHVGVLVIGQAYRAAGGRARHVAAELRVRVPHLGVALQGVLVDASLHVAARRRRRLLFSRPPRRGPVQGRGWARSWGGRGGSGAEVRCEGDGDDEEEHADGHAEAVAEPADPVGAEHPDGASVGDRRRRGVACGVHRGLAEEIGVLQSY